MPIRVLIADAQPRARRSLMALLTAIRWSTLGREEPSATGSHLIEIIGEAENGQAAIDQVEALGPDVVLMDLQLHPGFDFSARREGMLTIRTIKTRWPDLKIVVLTMYATDRASVLAAGADAFLLKGCSTRELLDAVMAR